MDYAKIRKGRLASRLAVPVLPQTDGAAAEVENRSRPGRNVVAKVDKQLYNRGSCDDVP